MFCREGEILLYLNHSMLFGNIRLLLLFWKYCKNDLKKNVNFTICKLSEVVQHVKVPLRTQGFQIFLLSKYAYIFNTYLYQSW